jgi:hypothetical protein
MTATPAKMNPILRLARRGSGMVASVQNGERARRFPMVSAILGPATDGAPPNSGRGRSRSSFLNPVAAHLNAKPNRDKITCAQEIAGLIRHHRDSAFASGVVE